MPLYFAVFTQGFGCLPGGVACNPQTPSNCCSHKCPITTSICEFGENGCVFSGGKCHCDLDCCSWKCTAAGLCESGQNGCVNLGGSCTCDSECCSQVCSSNVCIAGGQPGTGGCLPGGAMCMTNQSDDCCSGKCTNFAPVPLAGVCEPGENSCVFSGGKCHNDFDCCSGVCAPAAPGPGAAICEPGQNGCVNTGGLCRCHVDCCSGQCNMAGPNLTGLCA